MKKCKVFKKRSVLLGLLIVIVTLANINPVLAKEGPGEHLVWFEYWGVRATDEFDNDRCFGDWQFSVRREQGNWIDSDIIPFTTVLGCNGNLLRIEEYYPQYDVSLKTWDRFTGSGSFEIKAYSYKVEPIPPIFFIFAKAKEFVHTKEIDLRDHGVNDVNKWIYCTSKTDEIKNYYRYKIVNKKPESLVMDGPLWAFVGETYTFTASATDPEGDSLYYLWFVDGVYQWGTTSDTFTYKFTEKGKHEVIVKCQDYYGASPDPVGFEVEITEPTPGPEPDLGDNQADDEEGMEITSSLDLGVSHSNSG